jgi:nitroreductase
MTSRPDQATVHAAIALACRAPSVHNSQPWLWRTTEHTVQLFADPSRRLGQTDPHGRDLVMSCGAALHHLQVAFAASGWATRVHRVPDPRHADHLASVETAPMNPTDADLKLTAAITSRRSERRRLSSWAVPSQVLQRLADAAQASGGLLAAATEPDVRNRLVAAAVEAAARQNGVAAYRTELIEWSGRGRLSDDGVPAANVPAPTLAERTLRAFATGEAAAADPGADVVSGDELLVLATTSDDLRSQLLAGEALSAVLLTGTALGLATCPLTQPLEVEETRRMIRDELLGGTWTPQVLVRVGWLPLSLEPLPETPRRRLDDVLRSWSAEAVR